MTEFQPFYKLPPQLNEEQIRAWCGPDADAVIEYVNQELTHNRADVLNAFADGGRLPVTVGDNHYALTVNALVLDGQ